MNFFFNNRIFVVPPKGRQDRVFAGLGSWVHGCQMALLARGLVGLGQSGTTALGCRTLGDELEATCGTSWLGLMGKLPWSAAVLFLGASVS